MIKASFTRENGRRGFIFGLSAQNIKRLQDGQPIAFAMEPIGGTGDIVIMFGETEESIAAELALLGAPAEQP